jgi:hypothetical protein
MRSEFSVRTAISAGVGGGSPPPKRAHPPSETAIAAHAAPRARAVPRLAAVRPDRRPGETFRVVAAFNAAMFGVCMESGFRNRQASRSRNVAPNARRR